MYEHHLVWWLKTGEVVTGSMLIHHKNNQKRDNRFENLEKKTRADHTAHHNRERSGPPEVVILTCAWCSKEFEVFKRNLGSRLKSTNNHCSRSHSVKHQMKLAQEKRDVPL